MGRWLFQRPVTALPFLRQISLSIGTVSQSECIRCFKDTLGTTPLQYGRTPAEYRTSVRKNEKKGENVCDRF